MPGWVGGCVSGGGWVGRSLCEVVGRIKRRAFGVLFLFRFLGMFMLFSWDVEEVVVVVVGFFFFVEPCFIVFSFRGRVMLGRSFCS